MLQKFLLGDLAFGAHFQQGVFLCLDPFHPGGEIGEAGFLGLGGSKAPADQVDGPVDQFQLFSKDLFQNFLAHQLQLPVRNHGLVTVAGIVSPGLPPLIGGAVVEDVVALVTIGVGLVGVYG